MTPTLTLLQPRARPQAPGEGHRLPPPHTHMPYPALTSLSGSFRILHELCKSLGLNLTKFTQYDENTWIEVNNLKLRNYVVEKMPEKLGYKLRPREKGHSPEEIYQMALNRVGGRSPAAVLTPLSAPPSAQPPPCLAACLPYSSLSAVCRCWRFHLWLPINAAHPQSSITLWSLIPYTHTHTVQTASPYTSLA